MTELDNPAYLARDSIRASPVCSATASASISRTRLKTPRPMRAHDFLFSYPDLVAWGEHAGILTVPQRELLLRTASRQPNNAAIAWPVPFDLRAAIDRLFHAIARRESPHPSDVETVQQRYLDALGHADLTRDGDRFAWTWHNPSRALDAMLWPVARSAVRLLTHGELRRVKACPLPEGCSWLFYDQRRTPVAAGAAWKGVAPWSKCAAIMPAAGANARNGDLRRWP